MNKDNVFENIWHITPINDTENHIEKTDYDVTNDGLRCFCKCNPRHELQPNGAIIIIHNSFDGREGVEWTNELLAKFNKQQ